MDPTEYQHPSIKNISDTENQSLRDDNVIIVESITPDNQSSNGYGSRLAKFLSEIRKKHLRHSMIDSSRNATWN